MTPQEVRSSIQQLVLDVAGQIITEVAKTPQGSQPALGDGTFLKFLLELLPILLEILKMFPV